jgi:serine phosphatase RsbU (regulator of sigma subunit)
MNRKILAQVPLFKVLPEKELDQLAATLRVRELPPDTLLFSEGEVGDRFYAVIYGQVAVIKALGTTEERVLGVRGPGEFIGELSLLNRNGLRTASVRTVGEAAMWEMTLAEFDALLSRYPQMAFEVVRVLSERLIVGENATIHDLREKNHQLTQAYTELQLAQAQLVEKEKLEHELKLAYRIQMSILPEELPRLPSFDLGARVVPARVVGGDFFGVIPLAADKAAVFVGDVSDKGVPSAIFMARTHALLSAEAHRRATPTQVLKRVNRLLIEIGSTPLFVTVLYGLLDSKSGEFSYARAGHELPLVADLADGSRLVSWGAGQLLGIIEDPQIDEGQVTIPAGGTLLLYTDGVLDGRNPHGEPFGMKRLTAQLAGLVGQNAQVTCDQILQRLMQFQAGSPQDDDITLLAVHSNLNTG